VVRGINYDVGTVTGPYLSRPTFDIAQVRADLEVIRDGLHCEAVRISGTDPERLVTAAKAAKDTGLKVWLSPQLHDGTPDETLAYTTKCAQAAESIADVYLLGCELTLFMRGILKGDTLFERLRPHRMLRLKYVGGHNRPLNAFLAKANDAVRQVFTGPVSYASAPIERVDWSAFDVVCVDYYRGRRNRDDYGERLRRHFAHGKPVFVTEVGCCTYRGAAEKGGMGWLIVDPRDPDRLSGPFTRDEDEQAREVMDMLAILEREKAAGAFVFTFSSPSLPHREDPLRDLDMASYGVVKSYEDGSWAPKKLFHALADRNSSYTAM
jgi:hypothetical protein